MKAKLTLLAASAAFALSGFGKIIDDAAYDWYQRDQLPLEGRGFKEMGKDPKGVDLYFSRIPASFLDKVPGGVKGNGRTATGLQIRFTTDAKKLAIKWMLTNPRHVDSLIPPAGVQGVDVYAQSSDGTWRFCGNKRYHPNGFESQPSNGVASAEFAWVPGETGIIYLPTRGRVTEFLVGVEKGRKFAYAPHAAGHDKPIVHYGTSIVHGGCASRPGITYTAYCSRLIDYPYVNLGFSGSGKMEMEMADFLAAIDARLYLVDCVWNMDSQLIRERTVPFLKKLHQLRPDVPVLLCEGCNSRPQRRWENDVLKGEYEKLLKEDPSAAKWLSYFSEDDMLVRGDLEQTHDFCHPNDYGSMRLGPKYAQRIKSVLGE